MGVKNERMGLIYPKQRPIHDEKISLSPEPKKEKTNKQTFGIVVAQCQNHVFKNNEMKQRNPVPHRIILSLCACLRFAYYLTVNWKACHDPFE